MSKIQSVEAKEIFDSRGEATVEVNLATEQGMFRASAPSGSSRGKYEAKTLPARRAVKHVNEIIAPRIAGKDAVKQKEIDDLMREIDGAEDKSNLGANAILPVSTAVCRAGAAARNFSLYKYISCLIKYTRDGSAAPLALPRPCFNIIEGGKHSKNDLDIQEFMVVPAFNSFARNLRAGRKIYRRLKEILLKKFGKAGIELGDEAGFAPPIKTATVALNFIMQAIGRTDNGRTAVGLDCAASHFFQKNKSDSGSFYRLERERRTAEELLQFYREMTENYPIIFLEDPFSQDDWRGWQKIKSKIKAQTSRSAPCNSFGIKQKSKISIIGDDLTVTNPKRIKEAHQKNACNGVIIKPNQIGTVTETIEAAGLAKEFGWKIVVSHRSGETEDDFIADLAVAVGADFIKAGAPSSLERMAKYNRLLEIEKIEKQL